MNRFAVIGNPISHSKSPDLFNSVFSENNYDAYYSRIASENISEVSELINKLKIDVFNITSPYKSSIIELLNKKYTNLDFINTSIKNEDKWLGYNTDIYAIVRLIRECNLYNFNVLVIGAGDTAKTVLMALNEFNCKISLTNRTIEKSNLLHHSSQFNFININELKPIIHNFDLIINTIPKFDFDFDEIDFMQNQIIIDAIYHKPFLNKYSEKVNYISGLKWLEYQALPLMELLFDKNFCNTQTLLTMDNVDWMSRKLLSLLEECHSERVQNVSKIYKNKLTYLTSTNFESKYINDITINKKIRKNLFYLIGFSGSGKSTIAKELALKLNFKSLDTDEIIEKKENQLIQLIFNTLGEEYFRNTENTILKEVTNNTNAIIACGGGITENSENIKIMKQNGYIIWIYTNFEDCIKSINLDIKPKFTSIENYRNLYIEREETYFKSSDLIIYNNKDLTNTINRIYAEINNII
jgi:shikimate kinase/shikimate 5-dehydrogenase